VNEAVTVAEEDRTMKTMNRAFFDVLRTKNLAG